MRPYLDAAASCLLGILKSAGAYCVLAGFVSGIFLLACCHPVLLAWGTSLPMVTAMGAVIAASVGIGCRRTARSEAGANSAGLRYVFTHFALAGWIVALPWILQATSGLAARLYTDMLDSALDALGFSLLVTALTLAAPIYWIARIPRLMQDRFQFGVASDENRQDAWSFQTTAGFYLTGMAAGLFCHALLSAPWLGVRTVALGAALCGGAIGLLSITRQFGRERVLPSQDLGDACGSAGASPSREPVFWVKLSVVASIVILGSFFSGATRLVYQLTPASSYLVYAEWATLLGGLSLGMLWAGRLIRRNGNAAPLQTWACMVAAMWAAGLLIGFPWLIDRALTVNATVSTVSLSLLARCTIVGVVLLPIGIAIGTLTAESVSPARSRYSGDLLWMFAPAFVAGMLLTRWSMRWEVSPAVILVAVSWLLSALAAPAIVRQIRAGTDGRLTRRRFARFAAAVSACVVILGAFGQSRYSPATAAKLLFATEVFIARQSNVESRMLPVLDEGRSVAVVEGDRGTYTLWKSRGVQLQLRESGIPKGTVSTDVRIGPQFSAEIMQAVLPLVLHERPDRVLLLGMQAGTVLSTSLSFPVQELTCVEGDPALIRLVRERIIVDTEDVWSDPRLRLVKTDPALAVAAGEEQYDVIISSPDQSALLQSASYFTLDFYRRAVVRLRDGGIFCQRFQFIDYGAGPFQQAAKTMQAVFGQVAAFETASGEFLLLATDSPQGFVREGLSSRLQTPQVRRTLSNVGWDWSVVLNLLSFSHEALAQFADDGKADVNTAVNGLGSFQLPLDMLRWGQKWREIHEPLAEHGGRLLEQLGEEGSDPDILKRLAEVAGQRKLMTTNPDRYWAYRTTVREQVTKRPRTQIKQVDGKFTHSIHREDKRRMQYFKALGAAAKQESPTLESVAVVARFATPYDPLISYFLHREVAELYARSEERDLVAELGHRLRAVYYADSRDRSVRNTVAALELAVAHPEAFADSLQRRDQIDGLLQMLKRRWNVRAAFQPESVRVALNDIEKSITAVESSFEVMEQLTRECGLPVDNWQARQAYLERTIVEPLRSFRTKLLPHHYKQQRKSMRAKEADEP